MSVLVGALVPTAVSVLICLIAGANVDRSLGVSGAVLGIASFGLAQWQTQGPRSRRVVMVPKSRSPFSSSVHRGLADALQEYADLSLTAHWPASPQTDELGWQLGLLRSPGVLRADALVVVPAADDQRIWSELVRLSRSGVFIVVLDTKPTNSFFAERNAPRPCFVGSDFRAGGDLVGTEVIERLSASQTSRAVVAMGPVWSFPGSERSRAIAQWVSLHDSRQRVCFLELKTWDKEISAQSIGEAVLEQLDLTEAPDGRVVAFCGNDKILAAADRFLRRSLNPDGYERVSLVGYDGAVGADGTLMANEYQSAVATVDTQPIAQGVAAAELLIDEHRGMLAGRASRYVAPRLVRFES